MKIYNKKNFWLGMQFIVLALGLLILGFFKGFKLKNIAIMIMCFVIGVSFLMRSLSKEMSRKDRLDDMDERNRLVHLNSCSRANSITQVGSVILMGIFFGIGIASDADLMKGAGVGVAFCFTVSLWAEMFARLYYEKKN